MRLGIQALLCIANGKADWRVSYVNDCDFWVTIGCDVRGGVTLVPISTATYDLAARLTASRAMPSAASNTEATVRTVRIHI